MAPLLCYSTELVMGVQDVWVLHWPWKRICLPFTTSTRVCTHIFHSLRTTELVVYRHPLKFTLIAVHFTEATWGLMHSRSEKLSSVGRSVTGLISESTMCLRRFGTRWRSPHCGEAELRVTLSAKSKSQWEKTVVYKIKKNYGKVYKRSPVYYLDKILYAAVKVLHVSHHQHKSL